jgi:V/A-type H+-transporting ATPase subunit D
MARLNVNPNRMELRRLKNRLKTAVRGHKLLKDKADETVRQFMIYIRENKRLRQELEGEISKALKSFLLASAVSQSQVIEEAVAMPGFQVKLKTSTKNVMGVVVPEILEYHHRGQTLRESFTRMAFATVTTGELD